MQGFLKRGCFRLARQGCAYFHESKSGNAFKFGVRGYIAKAEADLELKEPT